MERKGVLQIEKRPIPFWLTLWIVALPLLWGLIFQLLSLPSMIKYTADLAWLGLLCFMVLRNKIEVEKKVFPLVMLIVVFFLYCLIMYLVNFQSIFYFLWGVRNNFRFYVLFFAVMLFIQERDAERALQLFDILFWLNFPVTLIQFFVFGYKQDYLGGFFGVESGANGTTIIFFTIVLSKSLIQYMERKESLGLCAIKCTTALFIAALAELKFFFVFFVGILVMTAFLTDFSWRKLLIFGTGAALVSVASTLLVTLFDFEDFLSLENIWKVATQKHYSSDETVNRLSAIPTLAETILPDLKDRLFGLGLGNCDNSSFEICNTPFFRTYGHLKYTYFSAAFLFLEVGYLGLAIYIAFFVFCFFLIRKRIKEGLCNQLHGRVALVLVVLSISLIVYNAILRTEAGYLVYFVLALPFVERDASAITENDSSSPAEEVMS